MAKKLQSESAAGQTAPGMDQQGKPRQRSGNANRKVRRVTFEPIEDGAGNPAGYVGENEYDNSGDGPYKPSTKSYHADADAAADHLEKQFGAIDGDTTLTAAEKRRAKAKASLGSSTPQETD